MTGFGKAVIALAVVGALALVIGTTWFVTKRNLASALTPIALPSASTKSTASNTAATTATTAKTTAETTPADTTATILDLIEGWNFVSIPGLDQNTVRSNRVLSSAYYLKSSTQTYESLSDNNNLTRDTGIAIYADSDKRLSLDLKKSSDTIKTFVVPLEQGWNLIGNPGGSITTRDLVFKTDTQQLDFDEALSKNIIAAYTWSPLLKGYRKIISGQTIKSNEAIFIQTAGKLQLIVGQ